MSYTPSSLLELLIFAILIVIAYYTGIPLDLLITISVALFIIWFVIHVIRDVYKNPSKHWPVSMHPEIRLNLNTGSLNIISLGDPIEKLSVLGPSLHGAAGYLYYDAIGLRFWIEPKKQTLLQFQVNNEHPNTANTHTFMGTVVLNGEALSINQISMKLVEQQLGSLDNKLDDHKIIYNRQDHKLLFQFNESKELCYIQVN